MINDKSSAAKPVLIFVILLAVIMALGAIVYLTMLKKPSPIAVQPATSPEMKPAPNETTTPTPITNEDSSFFCGASTVKDIDNNIYKTVQIGSQCWMKENFKVTKNPAGEPITRYCYDNDPKICDTDGGLYDWNTAMDNSTEDGAQGICPDGWHVPKDGEWFVLESGLATNANTCLGNRGNENKGGVGGCEPSGEKLILNGLSGFNAILAGYRYPNGNWNPMFDRRDIEAVFWSSTENKDGAWDRYINNLDSDRYANEKGYGFSIRCLKS